MLFHQPIKKPLEEIKEQKAHKSSICQFPKLPQWVAIDDINSDGTLKVERKAEIIAYVTSTYTKYSRHMDRGKSGYILREEIEKELGIKNPRFDIYFNFIDETKQLEIYFIYGRIKENEGRETYLLYNENVSSIGKWVILKLVTANPMEGRITIKLGRAYRNEYNLAAKENEILMEHVPGSPLSDFSLGIIPNFEKLPAKLALFLQSIPRDKLIYKIHRPHYSFVLELICRMLEAIKLVHEAGIVHCDLVPEHFILEGLRVRLIDFGNAQIVSEGKQGVTTHKALTADVGSPISYLAPSVSQTHTYSYKSDMYAFCRGIINSFRLGTFLKNANDRESKLVDQFYGDHFFYEETIPSLNECFDFFNERLKRSLSCKIKAVILDINEFASCGDDKRYWLTEHILIAGWFVAIDLGRKSTFAVRANVEKYLNRRSILRDMNTLISVDSLSELPELLKTTHAHMQREFEFAYVTFQEVNAVDKRKLKENNIDILDPCDIERLKELLNEKEPGLVKTESSVRSQPDQKEKKESTAEKTEAKPRLQMRRRSW